MPQGCDRRITLNTAVAQLTPAAVAVVSMDVQPHCIWSMTWRPALWAKLQRPGLLDCNALDDSI